MDMFQDQMTVEVLDILRARNIYLYKVPANMIHLFQLSNLAVNNHCKAFMKNNFSEWFAKQVEKFSKLGPKVEEIHIQFRLNSMEPLHAHWLVAVYKHIISASGFIIDTMPT